MPKIVVIANLTAGRGRFRSRWPEIVRRIGSPEVWTTESPGHAHDLALKAIESGAETILIAGGDGTISQIVSGCAGADCTLGILPLGTGNDLARHLGVQNMAAALACVADGKTIQADTIRWQTSRNEGVCVNIAGIGFDAAVAERINRGIRTLSGTAAYVAGVFQTLVAYQPVRIELEMDEETVRLPVFLCAVANASSYGGGMRIAPKASLEDGLMDVILVGDVSKGQFLAAFPRVFRGTHLTHPAVKSYRARRVRIKTELPTAFLIDGELVEADEIEFRIQPGSIRLLST